MLRIRIIDKPSFHLIFSTLQKYRSDVNFTTILAF